MQELLNEDMAWCVRRLPKDVFKLMKKRHGELFIAGGYIRSCIANEPISDIDIFSPSKDIAELCARELSGNLFKLLDTINAFTVYGEGRMTVQFIHKWTFKEPADVIPSFDFTIAKSVLWWDGESWKTLCDERFYQDLAAKRLVYCSPERIEEVGGSMLRVLKFYQKGYRIPLDSLGAVISRLVSGVNARESDVSTEEGMAFVISGLLREVDPSIDPNHQSHLAAINDNKDEDEELNEDEVPI